MSNLPATRHSLLIELAKRNDLAWAEFLEVYEKAILSYCRRRGLQEADARDAAQEVYAAIQNRVATWDPDEAKGSFRAWLFRVARNITVDMIVERKRTAVGQLEWDESVLAGIAQDPTAPSTEFDRQWKKALFEWAAQLVRSEVRQATWDAFRMTAIENQQAMAVAADLGIPIGSVYTAKCRVMARIRELVQKWDVRGGPAPGESEDT